MHLNLGSVHGILGASSGLRSRAFDFSERTVGFIMCSPRYQSMIWGSVHGILGASSGRCQNPSDCRRYTRQFFGIAHVEHRKTIILFSRKRAHPFDFLPSMCGCVLLFSSLFRGKYTMNRLRQFQKSRQIFQGVLFTGVRKFSLQIYRIVFDCFNRVPLAFTKMAVVSDYKTFGFTKAPKAQP